jgi:glycine/D-amino acid oxidase-like deaminating enzyme
VVRGKSDRVSYNTGHGHLGWTLAAATAEGVAALAAGCAGSNDAIALLLIRLRILSNVIG